MIFPSPFMWAENNNKTYDQTQQSHWNALEVIATSCIQPSDKTFFHRNMGCEGNLLLVSRRHFWIAENKHFEKLEKPTLQKTDNFLPETQKFHWMNSSELTNKELKIGPQI